MTDERNQYATYNGLNRPAMVMGVPLMLLLFSGFVAVFGGFGAIYLFGAKGLIVPSVLFLFLFIVRLFCDSDPNALRVLHLQFKGFLLKVKHQDIITGFSSVGR